MSEGQFPVDPNQQQVFPSGTDAFEQQLTAARFGQIIFKKLVKRLSEVFKQQKQNNSKVDIKFTGDNPEILVKKDEQIIYQGNLKEEPSINLLTSTDLEKIGQGLNYAAGQTVPGSDRNISIKIDSEEVFALVDGVVQVNRFKEHSITIDVEAISPNNNSKESSKEGQNNPPQPFQQAQARQFTENLIKLAGESGQFVGNGYKITHNNNQLKITHQDRGLLLTANTANLENLKASDFQKSSSFSTQDYQNLVSLSSHQQVTPESLSFTERMRSYTPLVMATGFEQLLGELGKYQTEKFTLSKSEDVITLKANDGRGQLLSLQQTDSGTINMVVSKDFNPQDWQNVIEMLYQQQSQKSEIGQTAQGKSSSDYSDYPDPIYEPEYENEPEYELENER